MKTRLRDASLAIGFSQSDRACYRTLTIVFPVRHDMLTRRRRSYSTTSTLAPPVKKLPLKPVKSALVKAQPRSTPAQSSSILRAGSTSRGGRVTKGADAASVQRSREAFERKKLAEKQKARDEVARLNAREDERVKLQREKEAEEAKLRLQMQERERQKLERIEQQRLHEENQRISARKRAIELRQAAFEQIVLPFEEFIDRCETFRRPLTNSRMGIRVYLKESIGHDLIRRVTTIEEDINTIERAAEARARVKAQARAREEKAIRKKEEAELRELEHRIAWRKQIAEELRPHRSDIERLMTLQQADELRRAEEDAETGAYDSQIDFEKAKFEDHQAHYAHKARVAGLYTYTDYRELFVGLDCAMSQTCRSLNDMFRFYYDKLLTWDMFTHKLRQKWSALACSAESILQSSLPDWGGESVASIIEDNTTSPTKDLSTKDVFRCMKEVGGIFRYELKFWLWHKNCHRTSRAELSTLSHHLRQSVMLTKFLAHSERGRPEAYADLVWLRNISSTWGTASTKLAQAEWHAVALAQWCPLSPRDKAKDIDVNFNSARSRQMLEVLGEEYQVVVKKLRALSIRSKNDMFYFRTIEKDGFGSHLLAAKLQTASQGKQEHFRTTQTLGVYHRTRSNTSLGDSLRRYVECLKSGKRVHPRQIARIESKWKKYEGHFYSAGLPNHLVNMRVIAYDRALRMERAGALDHRVEELKLFMAETLDKFRQTTTKGRTRKYLGTVQATTDKVYGRAGKKRVLHTRQSITERAAAKGAPVSQRMAPALRTRTAKPLQPPQEECSPVDTITRQSDILVRKPRRTGPILGSLGPEIAARGLAIQDTEIQSSVSQDLSRSASSNGGHVAKRRRMKQRLRRRQWSKEKRAKLAETALGECSQSTSSAKQGAVGETIAEPARPDTQIGKAPSAKAREPNTVTKNVRAKEARMRARKTKGASNLLKEPPTASNESNKSEAAHPDPQTPEAAATKSGPRSVGTELTTAEQTSKRSKLVSADTDSKKSMLVRQVDAPRTSKIRTVLEQTSAQPPAKSKTQQMVITKTMKPRLTSFTPSHPMKAPCAFNIGPDSPVEDAQFEEQQPEVETHQLSAFQIPKHVFEEAINANEDESELKYWSHTLYRGPAGQPVVVHYCRSRQTSEKVAALFLNKPILGFDIEWRPQARSTGGIKSNVSLIQLASEDRIALFQLALHKGETAEEILPPSLRCILESPRIKKAGVSIQADFTRLQKFLGITPRGLIELSHWHNLITSSQSDPTRVSKKLVSLGRQVEIHLKLPLRKGDVRVSDWSRELNHEQCFYAAADAYAGFMVYDTLEAKRLAMNPRPPRPEFAELKLPIKLATRLPVVGGGDDMMSSTEDDYSLDEDLQESTLSSELDGESTEPSPKASAAVGLTDEEVQSLELAEEAVERIGIVGQVCPDVEYSTLYASKEIDTAPGDNFVGRIHLPEHPSLPATGTPLPPNNTEPSRLNPSTESGKKYLFDLADEWARKYLPSIQSQPANPERHPFAPKSKARIAALRAFSLWEHHKLNIDQTAQVLRTPPLKIGTVAAYLAECLQFERLECSDWTRTKEWMEHTPFARYKELRQFVSQGPHGKRFE
jgi:hypothetical protein